MADFRKEALIRTLKEEYGITSSTQLLDAIKRMPQLDISQFVLSLSSSENCLPLSYQKVIR